MNLIRVFKLIKLKNNCTRRMILTSIVQNKIRKYRDDKMAENSELIERFFKYVKVDTRSSETTETHPSTDKQKNLALILVSELKEMGYSVDYDEEHCYIYSFIPSNNGNADTPVIGFIAHMDTSPEVSDENVKPRIIEYKGGDIELNKEKNIVMSSIDYESLDNYIGQHLIVTDGTTLLGADDKAGVAEIMQMAYDLSKHPEIKHGRIAIGFTPDEEIGEGPMFFDLKRFGADFGYTVDGGTLGIIEYENFNAAQVRMIIHGRNVHPGSAKHIMKNSICIGNEFQNMLPTDQRPEVTEGYEGFYFLEKFEGTIEKTVMEYLIRDHDGKKFEDKKKLFLNAAEFMNRKYGEGTVEVYMKEAYYNMIEKMKDHMHLIDKAYEALKNAGVEPSSEPIRGGTDGAALSFKGLPCPNLCTGGENYHSRFEYACVESMEKTKDMLLGIVSLYEKETYDSLNEKISR